ncbi:uncharacterized protein LOC131007561 [Salvia miltiorrhiza]|uniref:uncharacterized protein LOC131007561 n=1 Tax=Salvia miltiorrhiza TaxID=226208 RepID=UPI0025AD1BE8|nr:uncharacterized protein LOC131007561 [Salvia miltiorrhiza]
MLFQKMDFNVIVAKHIDRVQEIKKSSPKTVEADIAPEPSSPKANEPEIAPEPSSHETGEPENAPSPSPPPPPPPSPSPSQAPSEFDMFSMDFWTDEILREVEDIVSNFTAVNKKKILKNDYPRFNEIPSCSQPREEQEQVGEGLENLHV